jgi:hypothetical protein
VLVTVSLTLGSVLPISYKKTKAVCVLFVELFFEAIHHVKTASVWFYNSAFAESTTTRLIPEDEMIKGGALKRTQT